MACAPPTLNTRFNAAQLCRDQHGGVGAAIGPRRRAHHAFRARQSRGHRQHDGRGGQGCGAGRHVQARRRRSGRTCARRSRRALSPPAAVPRLRLVEARHGPDRAASAASCSCVIARGRPRIPPRDTAVCLGHAVEPRRVVAQGGIPALAHLVDDQRGAGELCNVSRCAGRRRTRVARRRRGWTSRSDSGSCSGQHLLHGQHQHGTGACRLEPLESFPEYVFAAHRVHGDLVARSIERNDGGRLAARQN